MSWTTTGGFISFLVVVLSCSTCGASPVNSTTTYQCLTDVDCQAGNISGYSYIRNIRYCCRSGDAIGVVFKSSGYGFAFGFTGDSSRWSNYDPNSSDSDDSSNGRSESEQNDSVSDESDDSRRDDDNGEVRCTCRPVDREKITYQIRNHFDNFWRDMYQKLGRLSRFWTW